MVSAVERYYIEPVAAEPLVAAGLEAAVARLDANSAYLSGADRDALESSLEQRFGVDPPRVALRDAPAPEPAAQVGESGGMGGRELTVPERLRESTGGAGG